MRTVAAPLLLLAVAGGALLFAYAMIRPALIIMILSGAALASFRFCLARDMRVRMGWAPLMLALGLPCAAWLLPSIWLLLGVTLIAVPLVARKSGEVAAVYLFALLLLPGLDQTLSAGSLKLFEFGVHDALAVGAGLRLVMRPGRARIARVLDVPLIALVLLLVVANARDTSVTNFLRVLINGGLDCALPYYVVSRSIRTVDDLKLCMVYLAAAAAVLSVILIYEARTSWPMYNVLYDHYRIPAQLMVKARGGVLRAGGPFLESTSIAMVLASCILAAWLSRPAFRSTRYHFAVLALLLAGLTMPQSRGAWIGLFIGMFAADLYRRRIGNAARRMAVIGALGLGLVAVAPLSPYLSETLGLSGGSADTVDYRQRLFDRGIEEYLKSPVIGYSSPEILVHLADLRQGEGIVDFVNTYIYFMLISGSIGLVIFVGGFVYYLARLWRLRHGTRVGDPDADARALVFAGLVMPMEMLIFTSFGGRPEVFVFVMFAFAAALLAGRERARASASRLRTQISGSTIALSP